MEVNPANSIPVITNTEKSNLPEISDAVRKRLSFLKQKQKQKKQSLPDVSVLLTDLRTDEYKRSCYTKFKINIRRSTFCRILKQSSATMYKSYEVIYSGRHKILKSRNEIYGSTRVLKSTLILPLQMAPKNKEYLICRELDHPNISNVYEMFIQDLKLDIVSEYLEGGELNNYLNSRNYDEIQAARYIYQISSALIYLHSHDITHRDIKPHNILFLSADPDSPLKLIDFDLCGKTHLKHFHNKVGTLPFTAPEVLEGDYDQKCDIWSLGIILYMMLHGIYPFACGSSKELYGKILHYDSEDLKLAKYVLSDSVIDLILKMLSKDPMSRLSASEVFNHPWVRQVAPPSPDLQTMQKVLKKFKSYSCITTMHKIILYYTTTQILSYTTIKSVSQLFIAIDRDGNGLISLKDLKKCMEGIDARELSYSKCLLKRCNFGRRKYLTYSEFMTIMIDWDEIMTEGMACSIFNTISQNNLSISKKKFMVFVNNQQIEDVWSEAFHYLVKTPQKKVRYI